MALPSRNAPCPCGSGKRYKRCHGGPGSPDPFLGVSEEIVGKHRDPRTGRTRTYRNDLVIRRIRDEHPQHARAFDVAFAKDIQDISTELAVASGLIEIGVENTAQAGDADALRRLGAALGNAVNSVAGALELVRCGYTLQPGMLLRSVVECVAVVLDVVVNEESITRFRARSYSPTGAASRAKKVLGLVGHLYGVLSNYHTHVTESHETEYPLDSTGEAAASALRMVKAAAALVALSVELLFQRSVAEPRYWKRQPGGELMFAPDSDELEFLKEFPRVSTDEASDHGVQLSWPGPS